MKKQYYDEIKKVMTALNINYMPSRSEIEFVTGKTGLGTAIGRNGGWKKTALEMGINTKSSISFDITNEIKSMILESIEKLKIDRMPSESELVNLYGDMKLVNKITKNGGFYKFANDLDLKIKYSETSYGIEYENIYIEKLNNDKMFNYSAKATNVRFPYDILYGENTKIDVKVSGGVNYGNGLYFTFNLESKQPRCDFYIVHCNKIAFEKVFIIPASIMTGKSQLSIGIKSKYDRYVDAWNLIEDHANFMSRYQ